jgi:hypothetical protein
VLIVVCGSLLLVMLGLRRLIAARSTGRLAQLRFRRLHGARVVELIGGRLDPQPGSPWIDTWIDARAVQLVAAQLDDGFQAGIRLLDHAIPVNVWHTSGDASELELPPSIEPSSVQAIVAALRDAGVDSIACGAPIDSEPRPPHIVRMRFGTIDELPERCARIAGLLEQLESLATPPN